MWESDDLKQALEHDSARRWPEVARLPDYPAARRLMRDAVDDTLAAGDLLFMQPRELAEVVSQLSNAIGKLEAARNALQPKIEGNIP